MESNQHWKSIYEEVSGIKIKVGLIAKKFDF